MNAAFLAAGILAGVTTGIHVVAGRLDTVRPLLASSLAEQPRRTLHGRWHMVTVVLGGSAVALLYLAAGDAGAGANALARFIALLYLASGLVFLTVALLAQGPRRLVQLPQCEGAPS